MSTRSTTHFINSSWGGKPVIIYRHCDGYPEGAGTDLFRFLAKVQEHTSDTRFNDASYLAAKYVVWLSQVEYAKKHDWSGPEMTTIEAKDRFPEDGFCLDFLSVGVMTEDPIDIEYRYTVDCGKITNGLPKVTCHRPDGGRAIKIPLPKDD